MNGQSVENGKQKHCITWRLNSRNKGDYMWNKQQIFVIKVILPTNRIMSDIKQLLESVIVILQIATKVGVCSCLEQITDKMRIKFPSNLWRLMQKTILREKCYIRKHFKFYFDNCNHQIDFNFHVCELTTHLNIQSCNDITKTSDHAYVSCTCALYWFSLHQSVNILIILSKRLDL